jgi:signal peptidase I
VPDRTAAAPAPASWGPALLRAARARPPLRHLTTLLVVVLLLAAVVTVREVLVEPVRIASDSMRPTLQPGDVVLVDRRGVDVRTLERGDVVTFRREGSDEQLLKRVVGLPGDRVMTVDAVLHVDGEPVDEPYVDFSEWDGMFTAEVVVPDDAVYVRGDDRLVSVDSRDFGSVPVSDLDGRAVVRLWPPARL